MKKHLTLFGLAVLLITAVVFTAFTQQEKNQNNQKEKQQKKEKKQDKPGNNNNNNQGKDNKEQHPNQGNNNNSNNDKNNGNDNKGKNDNSMNNGNDDKDYDYNWNRENFKDRHKIKNQDKVTICHKFNRNNEPAVTIRVSSNALKAHLNHGDVRGDCPVVKSDRYSDNYLRERNNYYNNVQESQDQVSYSRSILDYALARLTNSRTQLVTLQNNNMPQADIERKQATVLELEQNVSLLETLLGIAANMLVNKLQ